METLALEREVQLMASELMMKHVFVHPGEGKLR